MFQEFDSLFSMVQAFSDEDKCINHFRAIRWPNGVVCPHCGSVKVYTLSNKGHKCGDCLAKFSVRHGSIFDDSKIKLQKWFMAIYLITSHKKGISSCQLARDIKVTQKTAWFMLTSLYTFFLYFKSMTYIAITASAELGNVWLNEPVNRLALE